MSRVPLLLLAASLALAGCIGGVADDGAGSGPSPADESPSPADQGASQDGDDPPEPEAESEYAPGWPSLDEADIRPGVNVAGGSCTSNFLFRSPDNRTLYLGSAAHCFPEAEPGEPVSVAGSYQGRLAYSSWRTQERVEGEVVNDDNDFALVALPQDARDEVHPAVRDAGGPTGIAEDAARGDRVLAYGNSSLRPDAADAAGPREGYVTHRGAWLTSMYMVGPGVPGDSGSAVLTADGEALGVLVHLEILPQAGSNNAANLDAVLSYANQETSKTFELVPWRSLEDPTLPPAGP